MKKYLISLIVLFILNGCGPSAADKARLEQAAREELLREQEHAKEQQEFKNMLIELKSQLAGQETKLQSIKGFHLLRTADEKAQQVAAQTIVIEELKSQITNVQSRIDH